MTKVKIFTSKKTSSLEDKINLFLKNDNITLTDIKYHSIGSSIISALIIYHERKNVN